MPHESFIQWLTPYSISSVRYQMVSPRVSCFRPACFYLLTIHPLKWVHVAFCFFASLFAIELLFGHLQFIPVTVSYRPRYASFFYKVFVQHWIHRQRSVLVTHYTWGSHTFTSSSTIRNGLSVVTLRFKLKALVYDILPWRKVPESDARSSRG